MDIQAIDINKLKKAEYNPRKDLKPTDREYQKIKKSIQEFGYVEPIIINKDCTIIGGHQRLKVLKDLGYTEVQVVILDVDKTKEKALNVALNKISGEWDLPLLKDLLQDIDTGEIDIELTGFDNDEIEQLLTQINVDIDGEAIEDDFDVEQELENIEKQQETRVKRGEVWQLGKHRLMCGDSTNENDVKTLMNSKLADMVFTDPPYGMFLDTNYTKLKGTFNGKFKSGKKYNNVTGDNHDFKPELIQTIFKNFEYCKEIFLWGADYYAELLENKNNGSWIVWDKRDDNLQFDKMFGSTFELCWSKTKHKREIARVRWCGIFGMEKEFDKKRHHPTQKPINLSIWFLNKFSKENNLIIDLFGGSGSTLIACEQINRMCYMMELNEKYCDVIMARWEKLTGKQAIKIEGGEDNGRTIIE